MKVRERKHRLNPTPTGLFAPSPWSRTRLLEEANGTVMKVIAARKMVKLKRFNQLYVQYQASPEVNARAHVNIENAAGSDDHYQQDSGIGLYGTINLL